jgi:hypothetical protein
MIMMKSRKAPVTLGAEVLELGDRLSFLDVLARSCARNERWTLTVESQGISFTVLVDRNGPFNASGNGAIGAQALVNAAQLRSGRCTLVQGWPVAQPMYQPGLDLALKALLNGAVEPAPLPPHRGVDSLRNAEFRDAQGGAAPAEAFVRPVDPPSDRERLLAGLPTAAPAPVVTGPVVTAPVAPPAAPSWNVVPPPAPDASATDEPEADQAPREGGARRLATRALLWMVEADGDSREYSLQEAASMAGRGLVDGLEQMVHPFKRDITGRIDRVREDWEKSGEVAARQARKKVRGAASTDSDREFRLER